MSVGAQLARESGRSVAVLFTENRLREQASLIQSGVRFSVGEHHDRSCRNVSAASRLHIFAERFEALFHRLIGQQLFESGGKRGQWFGKTRRTGRPTLSRRDRLGQLLATDLRGSALGRLQAERYWP